MLKNWRQKLGYCSIVAAVPAVIASNLPVSRTAEAKKPQTQVIGKRTRNLEKLNLSSSKRALLKRQSEFSLPYQSDGNGLTPLSGVDDCPGRAIPSGNYTVAAPYIDSGNTTGANDTVTSIPAYYYQSYSAHGPDHVYTFTLAAHGPNAQIEVSTTSGSYKPLIYVIPNDPDGSLPGGHRTSVTTGRGTCSTLAGTAVIR